MSSPAETVGSGSDTHNSGSEEESEQGPNDGVAVRATSTSSALDNPPPVNFGPSPPFKILAQFCEQLRNLSGSGVIDKRRSLIEGFIENWRQTVGNDIYPAFRLLLPQLDSGGLRQLYNIKEKTLGRILVASLGIKPTTPEAKQLLEYKSARGPNAGNFAELAYHSIERRDDKFEWSKVTIAEVLEKLENLAVAKLPDQISIFKSFIADMNAVELKWLIRIVLRYLNIHVSAPLIFSIWHPDAKALFNVTNDLQLVCHSLWDQTIRLEERDSEIHPLRCFKPQKATFKHRTMDDFELLMGILPESFYIEEKVDGERMQLHYADHGRQTAFYSRNGKNYTEYYGDSVYESKGTLAPYLAGVIDKSVESCVLDGEVVAWDAKNLEICPLNKVKQAAISGNEGDWHPLFLVFDCLYVNGRELTKYSLENRKKVLWKILPKSSDAVECNRIKILPYLRASSAQSIKLEFEKVITQLSEGLVLKDPRSRYIVDGRVSSWIKVKPEFMTGFNNENFDLVIVAAEYGQGTKAGLLASFLCAVKTTTSSGENRFLSVCKVGNGFARATYQKIAYLLAGKWIDYTGSNGFANVDMGVGVKPDKVIDPSCSLVLEIKATQIVPTVKFAAGVSLRFPRFVSIREDKSYTDCMTFKELLQVQMDTDPAVKAEAKRAQTRDNNSRARKRARIQFQGYNGAQVELQQDIASICYDNLERLFSNLEFLVPGDIMSPYQLFQPALEQLIKNCGGTVVPKAGDDSVLIVADRAIPRVVPYLRSETNVVVNPSWIFDCIHNKRLLPFEPCHILAAPISVRYRARTFVDRFNIAFSRIHTPEQIKDRLDAIDKATEDESEIAKATSVVLESGFEDKGTMFHGIAVFIDERATADKFRLVQYIKFASGQVVNDVKDSRLTHVVTNREARLAGDFDGTRHHILSPQWVLESWSEKTRLDERQFAV